MVDLLQWLPFLLFVLLFATAIMAEIRWLTSRQWASTGQATGFVLLTDLVGFGVGFFIVLVVILILFMLVMGPAGRGSDAGNVSYIAAVAVGLIFPPIVLILFKRLMLPVFKIGGGRSLWKYSLASSSAVIAVTMLPPSIFFYLILTIWK